MRGVRVEYREEPCKSALNAVKGMGFRWSLNPYMGCVHRCTFCYVRHFEKRSDRPSDDRYGTSIRVKTNVAEVLRRELARSSWQHELVAIGAATDPYQPAEGKYRLTRACLEVLRDASNPFSLITRGPMIVRDLDVLDRGRSARGCLRDVLRPDAGRRGLEEDGAVDCASAAAAQGGEDSCRGRRRCAGRHGADSPRHLRSARATSRGRARRA